MHYWHRGEPQPGRASMPILAERRLTDECCPDDKL